MAAFGNRPYGAVPVTDYVPRDTVSTATVKENQRHPSFRPRYSGPESGRFWDAVNRLDDDGAYELAVVLQEFESDILDRLQRRIRSLEVQLESIRLAAQEEADA